MRRWSWPKRFGVFAVIFTVFCASFFLFKVERTFSLINPSFFKKVFEVSNDDGYREANRLDVLIMGFRGKGDLLNGEYLTDTMMVLSIDTETNEAALLSLPRDLYMRIPGSGKMEKINFAYAYGELSFKEGLSFATRAVEKVSGIEIDHAIAVDFSAFMKLIDMVGGIDVYVPKDFHESQQWGFDFSVPKGMNHMNAETALYYSRSRYSTSDFDRARRQQDVIVALGNKVLSLGVLANPIKLNRMLNAFSEGVDTNIDLITALNLASYAKVVKADKLKRMVLDDAPEGLLVSGYAKNMYVLYPRAGIENYAEIKQAFRTIFEEKQE